MTVNRYVHTKDYQLIGKNSITKQDLLLRILLAFGIRRLYENIRSRHLY